MCLYFLMSGEAFRNVTCLVLLKKCPVIKNGYIPYQNEIQSPCRNKIWETKYETNLFVCHSENTAFILILRITDFHFFTTDYMLQSDSSLHLQSNMKSYIKLKVYAISPS